ncbi:uncharacterized protein LOC102067838 isoform X2 [Zonotrichia albicollis]|uniref:uncharacterized protein LOC102067838 isoform X2 n=1 Tax=Zonotrichia albicollis TaxID=44394 RepID=UPI003D80E129
MGGAPAVLQPLPLVSPPIPAASLGVAGSEPPPPAAGSSAVRGCPVPGPCRYLGEPGLFLTWMCSVICFPHSTETGTAEGPGARRAGARDTSSWCAAKDGGRVLRPGRWPRAFGIRPAARRPSPRDLLLPGQARLAASKKITAPLCSKVILNDSDGKKNPRQKEQGTQRPVSRPADQGHLSHAADTLRMLYPGTAATLWFTPLWKTSAAPGIGVSLSTSGPTGLASIAWGCWGSRKTMLSYLEDADPAPSSWGR